MGIGHNGGGLHSHHGLGVARMVRWTEEQLRATKAGQRSGGLGGMTVTVATPATQKVDNPATVAPVATVAVAQSAKPSKHRNVATLEDSIRFDSKLEAAYYRYLKWLRQLGSVRFFLRQVPYHLPGGTVLRLDFQVHWDNGAVSHEDVKGRLTDTFKIKRREVEHEYGITITIVRREVIPKWFL